MSYWRPLQQALVTTWRAAVPTDVIVFDGPEAGREKGAKKLIQVGYSDSGSGRTADGQDPIDTFRQEAGTVVSDLIVWSGNTSDPQQAIDAWAIYDLLLAAVRADQTLGVLPPASTSDVSAEITYLVNGVRLAVSVTYTVRS